MEAAIVELMESGCSLIVGTVDTDGLPDATRGWGALVLEGGAQIRLLLATSAGVTLRNLRSTRRIALTATNFRTFDSVQVKGVVLAVEEATEADRDRFERFCAACEETLHEVTEAPIELLMRMEPSGVVACVMTVDEMFDQTPGPGAGTRLAVANVTP